MKIALIHGPNFTYLYKRDVSQYGSISLKDIEEYIRTTSERLLIPVECICSHSNIEGEIINFLEKAFEEECNGIILNAGAYSHTSLAIADCLEWLPIPVVEVHLSQIYSREAIRHHSMISAKSIASISGCGIMGYGFALELLVKRSAINE